MIDGIITDIIHWESVPSGQRGALDGDIVIIPTPGSHTFSFSVSTNANTAVINANGTTQSLTMVIDEVIRQSARNG
jgi:hypothetical protein